MITQEYLKDLLSYDPDTGVFTWIKTKSNRCVAGNQAGYLMKHGYRSVQVNGKLYTEHRLAWLYMYGYLPRGMVDHKNGNRADNRIDNLRLAGQSQQNANQKMRKDNTSGFRGVTYDTRRKKYFAQTSISGQHIFLGYFNNAEDAARAYNRFAKETFGEEYLRIPEHQRALDNPPPLV